MCGTSSTLEANEMDATSESQLQYTPPADWRGRIGRTRAESEPHWPDVPVPAAGTPDACSVSSR